MYEMYEYGKDGSDPYESQQGLRHWKHMSDDEESCQESEDMASSRQVEVMTYSCQYCGRVFTQSENLKVHIRIHTDERPYKCATCEYASRSMGNLKNHVRARHLKQKPYQCSECGVAFSDHSALRRHKDVHSTVTKHECYLCSKQYKQATGLSRHIRTAHPQERQRKEEDPKSMVPLLQPAPSARRGHPLSDSPRGSEIGSSTVWAPGTDQASGESWPDGTAGMLVNEAEAAYLDQSIRELDLENGDPSALFYALDHPQISHDSHPGTPHLFADSTVQIENASVEISEHIEVPMEHESHPSSGKKVLAETILHTTAAEDAIQGIPVCVPVLLSGFPLLLPMVLVDTSTVLSVEGSSTPGTADVGVHNP